MGSDDDSNIPAGGNGPAPQAPVGIQVLVAKAAVDGRFRQLLLADRAEAARSIGLELTPSEAGILNAIPREQLEVMIDNTSVPPQYQKVFMGCALAAMLAVVGLLAVRYLGNSVSKQFGCISNSIGEQPEQAGESWKRR